MTRDPSATLSLAVFFQQSRDWISALDAATTDDERREGIDLAAAIPDPLRGDPDDEQHHRIVELIRPAGVVRCPRCETVPVLVTPVETVPVLAPGELTPDRVRDRAGMVGTVLVLAAVYAVALGVLLAWIGGVL